MIISRTPFRISFFGGGTDYPLWYREHGGSVLATTIDKYCYISVRHLPPFFEHKHRIVYSQVEQANQNSEIKHPAVRGVMEYMNINDGLEIHHDGDLPARSGMGSSSSFTVGLLNALHALQGKIVSKRALASTAIHVEQNVIQETVGSQDQISAAFGGFNLIRFNQDDSFEVCPVILSRERMDELQSNLMLFFTGQTRIAATVAKSKLDNFAERKPQLQRIGEMTEEALAVLQNPKADIRVLGKLLHEAWKHKRTLSQSVSTSRIDEVYEASLSAGALGGKVLGAGGGGFVLLFVPPENRAKVQEKLRGLLHVGFRFETEGSKIVLYDTSY